MSYIHLNHRISECKLGERIFENRVKYLEMKLSWITCVDCKLMTGVIIRDNQGEIWYIEGKAKDPSRSKVPVAQYQGIYATTKPGQSKEVSF